MRHLALMQLITNWSGERPINLGAVGTPSGHNWNGPKLTGCYIFSTGTIALFSSEENR